MFSLSAFSFAFPWAFLLLPLPLLIYFLLPPFKARQPAVHIPFFDDMVALSGQTPASGAVQRQRGFLPTMLLILFWLLLLTALARPQWREAPISREVATRDLLLAVDLSASMAIDDFPRADGQKTSRLDAVKSVLKRFLAQRKGDRVGLVFFGTAPFVQAPFTRDLATIQALMNEAQVGMAGPKTAFGDAIGLAINLFKQSKMKDRLLIILTDGNDSSSRLDPEKAAVIARDNHIVIYTVAVGDPEAAGEQPLDENTLKAVARMTGGQYFRADDQHSLEKIYQQIDRLDRHKSKTLSYRPRIGLYYWPLAAIIIISLLWQIGQSLRGQFSA